MSLSKFSNLLVEIIAIGDPGTQFTMRTSHSNVRLKNLLMEKYFIPL